MKKFFIVLTIIVIIFIIGIIYFLLGNQSTLITKVNNEDEIRSAEQHKYNGKYLSANISDDWTIQELENNSGMDDVYKTDSNYIGLTGFNIKLNDNLVLSFRGVDGIGGINFCNKIYKFKDTEQTYIDNYIKFADERNFPRPEIIDLSSTSYIKITIFEKEVRRIGGDLYWNSSNEFNVFNPSCNLDNEIIMFKYLSFSTEKENSKVHTYRVKLILPTNKLDDKFYNILDEILRSLEYRI